MININENIISILKKQLDEIGMYRVSSLYFKNIINAELLLSLNIVKKNLECIDDRIKYLTQLLLCEEKIKIKELRSDELEVIESLKELNIIEINGEYIFNKGYLLLPYMGKYILIRNDDYSKLYFNNFTFIAKKIKGSNDNFNICGDSAGIIPVIAGVKVENIKLNSDIYEDVIRFNYIINKLESNVSKCYRKTQIVISETDIYNDIDSITKAFEKVINQNLKTIITGLSFNEIKAHVNTRYNGYRITAISMPNNNLYYNMQCLSRVFKKANKNIDCKISEMILKQRKLYRYCIEFSLMHEEVELC